MYYVIYGNMMFDETVNSFDEACELVRNYYGIYEPAEVFITEAND